MADTRIERDSMGEMEVPSSALWGASTQRAVENFPISGYRFGRRFIEALGLIKAGAAAVNEQLGVIDGRLAKAIGEAAEEMIRGDLDAHFVLDVFQTGSGTSSNMNANEVIANRAIQILGEEAGSKSVHPNDHVNAGQSSNDVIPTAMHISALSALTHDLLPALEELRAELARKAVDFDDIVKAGRTHLMDATPVRLGQEFSGYARQVELGIERLRTTFANLSELALGGTAVGTGINAPEGFAADVIAWVADRTGLPLKEAANHFEAQGGKDAVVELSGVLKTIAAGLIKIANDIRWLGSGPRSGIGELVIPAVQPGSSIMPGKENPVMAEALVMVCTQVIGHDATITWGGALGNFELNVMMPVMAHDLLESIRLLSGAVHVFVARCLVGLQADAERCETLVELTLPPVTALVPAIGYDKAAEISKKAHASRRGIREVAREEGVLSDEELDRVLDLRKMTEGGIVGGPSGG
jgi:fumarate hydratase class II